MNNLANGGTRQVPLLQSRAGRILLAIFVLRLGLVSLTIAVPRGALFTDSLEYLALSKSVQVRGEFRAADSPTTDLVRTPGYPLLLALLLPASPEAYWPVTLVQLALTGIAGLALFHALAWRGHIRAGTVSALLVLLSPNIALWSLAVLSEALFMFLIVMALLVAIAYLDSRRTWQWILSSFLLGMASYVRPIGLGLMVLWPALILIAHRGHANLRSQRALVAISLSVGVITILPWTLRNAWVHGQATFSSVSGKTFRSFNLASVLAEIEGIPRSDAVAILSDRGGSMEQVLWLLKRYPLPLVQRQVIGAVRTLLGMDIGTWSQVVGAARDEGFGIFQGLVESGLTGAFHALKRVPLNARLAWMSVIITLSILHSAALFVLILVGLRSWKLLAPYWRQTAWLAVLTAAYLILVPGAAGQARFRVPAEPFLALMAGVNWIGSRRRTADPAFVEESV